MLRDGGDGKMAVVESLLWRNMREGIEGLEMRDLRATIEIVEQVMANWCGSDLPVMVGRCKLDKLYAAQYVVASIKLDKLYAAQCVVAGWPEEIVVVEEHRWRGEKGWCECGLEKGVGRRKCSGYGGATPEKKEAEKNQQKKAKDHWEKLAFYSSNGPDIEDPHWDGINPCSRNWLSLATSAVSGNQSLAVQERFADLEHRLPPVP
ncbi:hypothetical protein LguiA_002217 [Lonicera macranthoides]